MNSGPINPRQIHNPTCQKILHASLEQVINYCCGCVYSSQAYFRDHQRRCSGFIVHLILFAVSTALILSFVPNGNNVTHFASRRSVMTLNIYRTHCHALHPPAPNMYVMTLSIYRNLSLFATSHLTVFGDNTQIKKDTLSCFSASRVKYVGDDVALLRTGSNAIDMSAPTLTSYLGPVVKTSGTKSTFLRFHKYAD